MHTIIETPTFQEDAKKSGQKRNVEPSALGEQQTPKQAMLSQKVEDVVKFAGP